MSLTLHRKYHRLRKYTGNDEVSCCYSDSDKILSSAFPCPHATIIKSNLKPTLPLIISFSGMLAYKTRQIKNHTRDYISCFREFFLFSAISKCIRTKFAVSKLNKGSVLQDSFTWISENRLTQGCKKRNI